MSRVGPSGDYGQHGFYCSVSEDTPWRILFRLTLHLQAMGFGGW